jgi:hypothetical protein
VVREIAGIVSQRKFLPTILTHSLAHTQAAAARVDEIERAAQLNQPLDIQLQDSEINAFCITLFCVDAQVCMIWTSKASRIFFNHPSFFNSRKIVDVLSRDFFHTRLFSLVWT